MVCRLIREVCQEKVPHGHDIRFTTNSLKAIQVRTVSSNVCKYEQTLSNLIECDFQKNHLYLLYI